MRRALVDTSVLVGLENDRFDPALVADQEWAISVVTLGELRLGVLMAEDTLSTARRLTTLEYALTFAALAVDDSVCQQWARLVATLRSQGSRMPMNDSWIAATALAHEVPVVTQDSDFDDVPGLAVIRV